MSELITVAGMTAYAGPVTAAETPLPADATDRVLLVITPNVFSCGPRPFASGGLLIDDLRLE